MRILILLVLPIAAAAQAAVPPQPSPTFDPLHFFAGRTEGRGTLMVLMSGHKPVTVHGRGRVEGDGTLRLDQTVIEGSKPATQRQWTFSNAGPGRYSGTLSDASGPVTGDVTGNRLHLHFHMHGGIVADQRIDLAADGQSARNHMTFRKLGVRVATLDETIRREP